MDIIIFLQEEKNLRVCKTISNKSQTTSKLKTGFSGFSHTATLLATPYCDNFTIPITIHFEYAKTGNKPQ